MEIAKSDWPVVAHVIHPKDSVGNKRLSEATLQDLRDQQGSIAQGPQGWLVARPERSRALNSNVSTRDIPSKVGEAAGGPLSSSMPSCLFLAWPISVFNRLGFTPSFT